jgi:hypothetical protein
MSFTDDANRQEDIVVTITCIGTRGSSPVQVAGENLIGCTGCVSFAAEKKEKLLRVT